MILQGSLRIEFNHRAYQLMVKTFLRNGTYYFYIRDKEKEKPLLAGKILELTFKDFFISGHPEGTDNEQRIPAEIIIAIENKLLENKQLWFYSKPGSSPNL